MAGHANGSSGSHAPRRRPVRADTLDLKQKLAIALGENGTKYWQTFVQFCKGSIDRSEFEELAHKSLKPEHVHLHNALILGILYNASADVPGPSSKRTTRIRVRRTLADGTEISEDETDDEEPSKKRMRMLVAGLTKKERMRLKSLENAGKLGVNSAGGALSLGWAGSAADMLEKKRKEEEKRKVAEDRRKVREVKSAIGARDWRGEAFQATAHVNAVRGKLSLSTQQSLARAMVAPLCVESKQLPDLDGIRDRMTLLAVEAGMPGGVSPQAAAVVLSALQGHLQNLASSIITKVRSNRPNGIRILEPQRPASESTMDSFIQNLQTSPDQVPMDIDENSPFSIQSSPVRHLRSLHPDLSTRTMASAVGTSFADSSMLSLASTAPTSLAGPSSPSIRDGDSSQMQDTSFTASQDDSEERAGKDGDMASATGPRKEPDNGTGRLTIADMAFLLQLAPHTVVEPMGQGTQERLLAPDWEDEDPAESGPDKLYVQAAKAAATTKLSETSEPDSVRGRFIIDQSAPLRLLDRRALAERPTKGGLSLKDSSAANGTAGIDQAAAGVLVDTNGRKKDASHRHRDDMYEVVDPVALFGSLVD